MTSPATPQTRTVMEAGFTLHAGIEEMFWRANDAAIPTAAAQPGFLAVAGGPIANSSWLYFSGTWATPDTMDQWYWSSRHKPMQDAAFSRWFAKMYIRKWRLPDDGEALTDRILCQTRINRSEPLNDAEAARLVGSLAVALAELGASAFETLTGETEPQPFQLVGPLQELPETAPASYLLLTHWGSAEAAGSHLRSPAYHSLSDLGDISSEMFVPIAEEAGTRPGLRADGLQRDWTYETGPWKSFRTKPAANSNNLPGKASARRCWISSRLGAAPPMWHGIRRSAPARTRSSPPPGGWTRNDNAGKDLNHAGVGEPPRPTEDSSEMSWLAL